MAQPLRLLSPLRLLPTFRSLSLPWGELSRSFSLLLCGCGVTQYLMLMNSDSFSRDTPFTLTFPPFRQFFSPYVSSSSLCPERSTRLDFSDFYFKRFYGVAATARFLGTSMASKFLVSAWSSRVELDSGGRSVVAVGCVMTEILGGQLLKQQRLQRLRCLRRRCSRWYFSTTAKKGPWKTTPQRQSRSTRSLTTPRMHSLVSAKLITPRKYSPLYDSACSSRARARSSRYLWRWRKWKAPTETSRYFLLRSLSAASIGSWWREGLAERMGIFWDLREESEALRRSIIQDYEVKSARHHSLRVRVFCSRVPRLLWVLRSASSMVLRSASSMFLRSSRSFLRWTMSTKVSPSSWSASEQLLRSVIILKRTLDCSSTTITAELLLTCPQNCARELRVTSFFSAKNLKPLQATSCPRHTSVRSCVFRKLLTTSLPKHTLTPRSLSVHPSCRLLGSAHSRSQGSSRSEASRGLGMRLIWSRDCRQGLNPPWRQKIFSSTTAAQGRAVKASQTSSQAREEWKKSLSCSRRWQERARARVSWQPRRRKKLLGMQRRQAKRATRHSMDCSQRPAQSPRKRQFMNLGCPQRSMMFDSSTQLPSVPVQTYTGPSTRSSPGWANASRFTPRHRPTNSSSVILTRSMLAFTECSWMRYSRSSRLTLFWYLLSRCRFPSRSYDSSFTSRFISNTQITDAMDGLQMGAIEVDDD